MDKNLNPIAVELFGKIRTQFPKIKLGNANSDPTDREEDARFFEFDFVKNGVNLGTVSADLSEDDGLVVIYSNEITDGQPSSVSKQWYNFLRELREFAKQNMMKFSIRDTSKSNLEKRDYEHLANKHGEGSMTESKLYGTSKTSFQEMGEAKLIVRHSQPVNYDLPAGRTLHIESIYVENADGERFKYPFKHLNGARALATHVAHGGNSYDSIGQHIIGLSEELNKLRMFKGYVSRNPIVSEAMGTISNKVFERIDQVKKEIHSLQSSNYYKTFAESFTASDAQEIPEDIVNDWVDRLTIRTFNEELKNVFPYIYKLVGEEVDVVKELSVDDLLDENTPESSQYDPIKEIEELQNFESYLGKIIGEESNLFNADDESQSASIQTLNQLIAQEFPAGADGTNAIQSLKGVIDDQEFLDAVKQLGKINPEMDIRDLLKSYLEKHDEENGTDIASKINFDSTTPAPTEPAPAAPPVDPAAAATTPPVAEGMSNDVEEFLHRVARSGDNGYDMLYNAQKGKYGREIEQAVQDMYDDISIDTGYHGDDDFEQIYDRMIDNIQNDYGHKDVAEEKEDPPFDGPYKKPGDNKDQFGNVVKNPARHAAKKGMAAAIAKAKKAGATAETMVNFGSGEMSLGEAITKAGMDVEEFFEGTGKQNEIVEFVKSMYDETTGNFPKGETGVLLAVEKQFGEDAAHLAHKVISELSQIYESKRMRQLAGISEASNDTNDAIHAWNDKYSKYNGTNGPDLVNGWIDGMTSSGIISDGWEENEVYEVEQRLGKEMDEWEPEDYDYVSDNEDTLLPISTAMVEELASILGVDAVGEEEANQVANILYGSTDESTGELTRIKQLSGMVRGSLGNHNEPNLPESAELAAMLKIAGLR